MFIRFRSMPATAMAAVLGCALMTTATPAAAQKKEKPKKQEVAKGKQLAPSKGFAPALKKMTDASAAKDAATLQAALTEGQASATAPDDKYLVGFYQLQLGVLNKDQTLQAQGLDVMVDSGLTPAENIGVYNFYSGNFAYGAKNYPKAIQRLEAAKAAGSTEAPLTLMLVDSYLNAGQLDQGLAAAKAAIETSRSAGQRPSDELYVRPIKALQAAKRNDEALDLMTLRMRDYNQPAVWRQTLFILLQQTSDKEIGLDVLRLMRATNAMTERPEYLEYAALATEAALPGEVVSLIKAGKASKAIPTPDAKLDEVLKSQSDRIGDEESTLTAYAAKPSTQSNPKVAGATGDAMVGYGRYADAVPLYKAALAAGGDKELWTYRLGVAQSYAGDAAGAKASFAQVAGSRKRLAQLWMTKIDAAAAPAAPAAAPAAPATGT
ncbi:tetratricopeptide repeat protein [Sphingopyxis sp.]|uniref:tetratricopeptide repeat protein n=1 Tax=Sphingopyxis sp. TaxID=1908224 RepID=UPI003D1451B9